MPGALSSQRIVDQCIDRDPVSGSTPLHPHALARIPRLAVSPSRWRVATALTVTVGFAVAAMHSPT